MRNSLLGKVDEVRKIYSTLILHNIFQKMKKVKGRGVHGILRKQVKQTADYTACGSAEVIRFAYHQHIQKEEKKNRGCVLL